MTDAHHLQHSHSSQKHRPEMMLPKIPALACTPQADDQDITMTSSYPMILEDAVNLGRPDAVTWLRASHDMLPHLDIRDQTLDSPDEPLHAVE